MRTSPLRPLAQVLASTLCLLILSGAAACGGGGGTARPSRSTLSSTIEKQTKLTKQQSDCVAGKLVSSKLSDKVLQGVAKDDEKGLSEKDKTTAGDEIAKAAKACVGS